MRRDPIHAFILGTPVYLIANTYAASTKCHEPARENVMNAHGRTRLFLVVVNQPKIQ